MRKLSWGSFGAGLLSGAFLAAGVATCILPALALIVPANYPPRKFPTQQTHYLRFSIPFNACVPVGNCSIKVGALPYNAYLLRINYQGVTAFGSTTNLIALGTTSAGTNIMAALTGFQAAINATTATIVAANAGVGNGSGVGNGATQTGGDGGFDVWATLSFTGSAPAAGLAVFVIEYAAPNDGQCTDVPMNSTATAC
jgi:hypothetical protein